MPFKKIYESDFYRIEIDQENDLLCSEWLRNVNLEEMMTGGTKMIDTLRDTGITRAVVNAKKLTSIDNASKEWMSTQVFALLSQTKLKKLARVLPDSIFSKLALEAVAARGDAKHTTDFVYKNFSTQQEALHWFKQ